MGRRRKKDKHLPERVYKKHGAFYYVTLEGKWTNIVGEPDELVTMADVVDRYILEELPKKAETTQKDQRRKIQNLRRTFGHMKPVEITPQHIFAYRDKRGRTAPIQANREKSLLSHIFMEWGVASTNPCRGVPRFTEIKRDRYIEDDEFKALYKTGSPLVQCVMDIAYMTSMDLSVILNLPPIDTKLNEFKYKRRKTRKNPVQKTMVIELTPELKTVIERAKNLPGHIKSLTRLIRNREGKPYTVTGFESQGRDGQRKGIREGRSTKNAWSSQHNHH